MSFLTCNIDGDDRNVFPDVLKTDLAGYKVRAGSERANDNQGWILRIAPKAKIVEQK